MGLGLVVVNEIGGEWDRVPESMGGGGGGVER